MLKFLEALLTWSMEKAKGPISLKDGKFEFNVQYTTRFYSPVFWVISILFIIPFLWRGGLERWVEITFEDTSGSSRQFYGTFKKNIPVWRQKYILWILIYTDY